MPVRIDPAFWNARDVIALLGSDGRTAFFKELIGAIKEGDRKLYNKFISSISSATRLNKGVIQGYSLELLAENMDRHFLAIPIPALMGMLISYHMAHKRSIMSDFLDQLGIPNENGSYTENSFDSVSLDADNLRKATLTIRNKYQHRDVLLYIASLVANDKRFSDITPLLQELIESQSLEGECNDTPLIEVIKQGEDIQKELDLISGIFSGLSESLKKAADQLMDPGILPDAKIVLGISQGMEEFTRLQEMVLDRGRQLKIGDRPEVRQVGSLAEIRETLARLSEYESDQDLRLDALRQTSKILEKVLFISHRDQEEFVPLIECQRMARELNMRLFDDPVSAAEELSMLEQGKDPYSKLLTLLERWDDLTDAEYEENHRIVREAFGKTLDIAVTRGRLILSDTQGGSEKAKRESIPTEKEEGDGKIEGTEDLLTPLTEEENTNELDSGAQTDSLEERPGGPQLEDKVSDTPPIVQKLDDLPQQVTSDISKEKPQASDDSSGVAADLLSSGGRSKEEMSYLVWKLVQEERLGLAYHLAKATEGMHKELSGIHLPSWIIRAVGLAGLVRYPAGPIALALKEDLANYSGDDSFPKGKNTLNHSLRLMLAAASLRPVLLAPETHAFVVLSSLRFKDGLSNLYNFCQSIATYGSRQTPIDPKSLKRVKDEGAWHQEFSKLQSELEHWWSHAPQLTIVFRPANRVWKKWLQAGGIVHGLMQPVLKNDLKRIDFIREVTGRLQIDSQIRREVDYTDRTVNQRKHGERIIASAFEQLKGHLSEGVSLVARWLDMQDTRPGQNKSFVTQRAEELRKEVWKNQGIITQELEAFIPSMDNPLITAAVSACLRAVKDIKDLFDPNIPFSPLELAPKYILHSELLKIPEIDMGLDWTPTGQDMETLQKSLVALVAGSGRSWENAFKDRMELRDHVGTNRIIEILEQSNHAKINIEKMKTDRTASIEDCRQALEREVDVVKKDVEEAVALGLLTEKDRAEFSASIERIGKEIPEAVDFHRRRKELGKIRSRIAEYRTEMVKTLTRRMEESGVPAGHPGRPRIEKALGYGDVLSANELLSCILRGDDLPEEGVETYNVFAKFFPSRLREISDYLEPANVIDRPEIPKIIGDLKRYGKGILRNYQLGPIPMYDIAGKQAEHAAELIENWFELKKLKKPNESNLRAVLSNLGFTVKEVRQVRGTGKSSRLDVEVRQLKDKRLCPIAHYGSLARGRYQLLCTWDRPTEEDLLHEVGEIAHGAPVIVLYFGRLTENRRRNLAAKSRELRRNFLVLDDILLLHLCGEREPRLPSFFRCALPFTFLEPYTITAGLVPPEIFYGRARERDLIIDPMGTCFIFGGRQLGKTAILRDVERTLAEKGDHIIARWIDLKAEGIGYNRPADDIWLLLRQEFKERGILEKGEENAGPDRILSRVRSWLNENTKRRILLLLDEADHFLNLDSKDQFIRASKIKGLMDQTDRRFKVVFAGLHNVQRSTRMQNNPLAHFGEPICIGPLLDNGESREARALVMDPMSSLGFHFEDADLVTRILSQTNYYPSLIQLYCNQLLKHVNGSQKAVFDSKTSPPFEITHLHVDDAYRNQQLRKAIRDRFIWTLDLDERYKVIAFAISLYSGGLAEYGQDDFQVRWIREQAMTWWPEGFATLDTEDAFRTLLEEMVGLGVLRTSSGGRYGLRSPNLISLIGTQEEIESELSKERQKPPEYDPETFRTAYKRIGEHADPARRNPLTISQENSLYERKNGVYMLFGCKAAGLDEIVPFMGAASGTDHLILLDAPLDQAGFRKHLAELTGRDKSGNTVFLVTDNCPWSEEWVKEAKRKIGSLKSKTSFVKVVFIVDPATAWRFIDQGVNLLLGATDNGVGIFTLRPWHGNALQQWLDDCAIATNKSQREMIGKVTGNWPFLLKMFFEHAKSGGKGHTELDMSLRRVGEYLEQQEKREEQAKAFGVDAIPYRKVLSDLQVLGDENPTIDDLVGLADGVSHDAVEKILRWGDLVGLISPVGGGKWRLDPVVGNIVAMPEV